MTDEEYQDVQQSLEWLVSLIRGMPLEAFIERADRSLAVGVFVDPALHANASEKLKLIADSARDLRRVQERTEAAAARGVVK